MTVSDQVNFVDVGCPSFPNCALRDEAVTQDTRLKLTLIRDVNINFQALWGKLFADQSTEALNVIAAIALECVTEEMTIQSPAADVLFPAERRSSGANTHATPLARCRFRHYQACLAKAEF